jgi:hypothetical protein
MLGTAAAIFLLSLLPSQVNALLTTEAKCLPGYEWMWSSVGQSPCDIAAELASVCIARPYILDPLPVDYVYSPPTVENQNSCKCSSVYYSLLSGCAYCQDRSFRGWSLYVTNCSTVYLTTYNHDLPVGVKVPAYAYLNVSISGTFNATLAYSVTGTESSRPPSSNTQSPTQSSTSTSTSTAVAASATNTPAIIGGAVGGVIGLGLIATLIIFLVLRSKRKSHQSVDYNSTLQQQQTPNMAFTPNTTTSLLHSTMSPPPGSPGMLYNPNDPSTYPVNDPNMYSPQRQQSPPIQNAMPNNLTGNSSQNYVPPQTMPMPQPGGGRPQYSGVPEL